MYIYIAIIRSQKELFDGKTNCSYHSVADPGFSRRGGRCLLIFLAENCMKMKEFRPSGGGGRGASLAAPLDPPLPLLQIKSN